MWQYIENTNQHTRLELKEKLEYKPQQQSHIPRKNGLGGGGDKQTGVLFYACYSSTWEAEGEKA